MVKRAGDEEKLRGLANAAVARAKHEGRQREPAEVAAERPLPAAALFEPARNEARLATYAPPSTVVVDVADSARIHTNVHIKQMVDGPAGPGGGTLVMGEGSSLKINAHIDTLVGSPGGGTIVLEKGARVEINAHIGTLVAGPDGGTLRVGEDATYRLNLHADVATTGGRVEVPDNVSLKLDVHAGWKSVVPGPAAVAPGPMPVRELAQLVPEPEQRLDAIVREAALPPDHRMARKKEVEDADPLRELRDVRWRLMRDIVAMADKQRARLAEDDERNPRGKALGHRDRIADQ